MSKARIKDIFYEEGRAHLYKDESALVDALAELLSTIEKETWLEAADAYDRYRQSSIPKAGAWMPPQDFAAWCRQHATPTQEGTT